MSVTAPGSWRGLNVRPRYTKRHMEVLLPQAVWGIEPERPAPIPDYRKGGDNRASDMPAMFADMQRAWQHAVMPIEAKRALFRHLAQGLTHHEVGQHEGIARETASLRYRAGMYALLAYLNGDDGE